MKFGVRELIFVLLMIGMLGGSYFMLFKPRDQRRLEQLSQIQAKQKALSDLQHATAGIDDLKGKIADLEKAIAFFESKLPQEKEIDRVLKEVWQVAEANGLNIRKVQTLKTEKASGFSVLPVQINLAGDFDGYYQFLLQLEKLPRITQVNQMQLTKIQEKDGQMQALLTLTVFFEPESGPTPSYAGAR